jgi:hypothetical protein
MVWKKDNKPKIREWSKRLKELQKVELPRAKLESSILLQKKNAKVEELIDAEEQISSILKQTDKIKKVIRNLKREKKLK